MLQNEPGEDGLEYGANSAGGVVAVHPSGTSGIFSSKITKYRYSLNTVVVCCSLLNNRSVSIPLRAISFFYLSITVLPTVEGEFGVLALISSFLLFQSYPYPVAASSVFSRHWYVGYGMQGINNAGLSLRKQFKMNR